MALQSEASFTVEGIEETCAWLQSAGKYISGPAIAYGLDKAARVIAAEIASRIPEQSEGTHSSDLPHLRDELDFEVVIDSEGRGGYADVGFGRAVSHIARFVEYGHRMIGHKPGLRELSGPNIYMGRVLPLPFMRVSAAASANAAIEAFVGGVIEAAKAVGMEEAA